MKREVLEQRGVVPPPSCVPCLADAITTHLRLHSSHWRPKTLRFHSIQLRVWSAWLASQGVTALSELTGEGWADYIDHRRAVVSDTTLHHDGQSVRLFLKECVRQGWLTTSPLDGLKLLPLPVVAINAPSTSDLNALLLAVRQYHDPAFSIAAIHESPEERAFHTKRNLALVVGLIALGCRVGELLAITLDDIDVRDYTVTFTKTKTHKARQVPCDDPAAPVWIPLLREYLAVRPRGKTRAVFVNESGEPWTYNAFRLVWEQIRERAGLTEVTIHSLRHFALTKLYVGSGDLKSAMQFAGHTSAQTALRYQHRDMTQIRKAVCKAKMTEGLTLT